MYVAYGTFVKPSSPSGCLALADQALRAQNLTIVKGADDTDYLVVGGNDDVTLTIVCAPRPDGKPDVRFHVAPQIPAPPPALNAPGRPGEAPSQPKTVTSFVKEAQEKAKSLPGYGFGGGTGGPGNMPTTVPGGGLPFSSGYGMMGGSGFNPYSAETSLASDPSEAT